MEKIFGSYYDDSHPADGVSDNTPYLRENNILSSDSAEAASWGRRFREKIARGEKVYLLGFQGIVHNSGASLIEASKSEGIRILANCEEERFLASKHFAGYPGESLKEITSLLKQRGKTPRDIFCVFYAWDVVAWEKNTEKLKASEKKIMGNMLYAYMVNSVVSEEACAEIYNPNRGGGYVYSPLLVRLFERLKTDLGLDSSIACIQMLHHENHAYFSYGASPFYRGEGSDRTTIVSCIDGIGDLGSASLFKAKGRTLELIRRASSTDSLGSFYELLSSFLGGWAPLSSEGRYMGAAAWGNNNRLTNPYYSQLRQYFYFADGGRIHVNAAIVENGYAPLQQITGPFLKVKDLWEPDRVLNVDDIEHSPITRERVDKASAVQMVFEDALFHIIGHLIRETGSDQLVLCGGTALNCVANMRLLEHFNRDYYQRYIGKDTQLHIWIPPVPSDQGVVIGAPYQFAMRNGVEPAGRMETPFICGLPPSNRSILDALVEMDFLNHEKVGTVADEESRKALADWMAYIVSRNGVIGIFQGAAETGPRALGHRSILSNPCNADTLSILNSRVKLREAIRPLAPMMTIEEAKKRFKLSIGAGSNDYDAYNYMVLTAEAKEHTRSVIPAVVHHDGTSRIQIVREENNPLMFEYLTALGRHIGVEVSVNTSLNVGSPIVQTPRQAFQIFRRAKGLDCIFAVADEGDVFMVWAKNGVQEFDSNIQSLRLDYQRSMGAARTKI